MKEIFNIKRFADYFVFELRRAWSNVGLSAVITGLLPVLFFIITECTAKLFTGCWAESTGLVAAQWSALCAMLCVTVLVFPTKLYGSLTEKRFATDFLTLPVSTFEKWLQIAAMCFVVIPLFMGTLFFGSDALLSILVPSYGDPVLPTISELSQKITESTDGEIQIDLSTGLYTSICQNLLIFCLGAIFFKKAKAAKTILVCLAVPSVLSAVIIPIIDENSLMNMLENGVILNFNLWCNLLSALLYAVLLGGIYARLSTLKQ